jgi:hypothetical protein
MQDGARSAVAPRVGSAGKTFLRGQHHVSRVLPPPSPAIRELCVRDKTGGGGRGGGQEVGVIACRERVGGLLKYFQCAVA